MLKRDLEESMERAIFAALAVCCGCLWASNAACQDAGVVTEASELDSGKPLSLQSGSDVLPLATAPVAALPGLSARPSGCDLVPQLRCPGPCYPTCEPLIYYGENPRDDAWRNPLTHAAWTWGGQHWYEAARSMVLRKKACAECAGGH